MNEPMANDSTSESLSAQLLTLSDLLQELKLLSTFLYDAIAHMLHEYTQDHPERTAVYQGLLLFMQQLSAKSEHIEQIYEQLYAKLIHSSEA